MAAATAGVTAADPAGSAAAGWGDVPAWAGGWIVLVLVALPVVGKVVIVWLALRNTAPTERPPIIAALADLLRPWRGDRRGPAR